VRRGNLAVISQSGNSSQSIFNHGLEIGLGFSKFISSGNEADLRFEDYLEYLAQDDKTEIILGYVEGLREGRRFLELAKRVVRKKPIIVMPLGLSGKTCAEREYRLNSSNPLLDKAK
jgi:acyl-CoA synthetase (NDP forming)